MVTRREINRLRITFEVYCAKCVELFNEGKYFQRDTTFIHLCEITYSRNSLRMACKIFDGDASLIPILIKRTKRDQLVKNQLIIFLRSIFELIQPLGITNL